MTDHDDQQGEISVESFAHGLTTNYLACRELGHVWKPWGATWDRVARAYDRRLRCSRCRTERVQLINDQGHVLTNRYNYSSGYEAKNVEKGVRVSRDIFRLEALTRFLQKE